MKRMKAALLTGSREDPWEPSWKRIPSSDWSTASWSEGNGDHDEFAFDELSVWSQNGWWCGPGSNTIIYEYVNQIADAPASDTNVRFSCILRTPAPPDDAGFFNFEVWEAADPMRYQSDPIAIQTPGSWKTYSTDPIDLSAVVSWADIRVGVARQEVSGHVIHVAAFTLWEP